MQRVVFSPFVKTEEYDTRLDFNEVWNLEPHVSISTQRTSDVILVRYRSLQDPENTRLVYRKRYWYPGIQSKIKGFFRNTFFGNSRAKSEFTNLLNLFELRLCEVRALAVGEDRSLRFLNRAFLLTECLPNTTSLESFLRSHRLKLYTHGQRKGFLCALGRWLYRLHHRGYRDGDLFTRNILVHFQAKGWRFSKIDSPKGTGGSRAPGSSAPYLRDLKDLDGDLNRQISRHDRLRLGLAYFGFTREDREKRVWIRKILD
jgi:hypothetical protein